MLMPKDIDTISIGDAYILQRVKAEASRRKDRTITKTASRLIIERLAQIDYERGGRKLAELHRDQEPAAAA